MKAEFEYANLVQDVLRFGEYRVGRNGATYSTFAKTLKFDINDGFPILFGRQIFYKGVLGELAAMLKGPKTLKDFEDEGCNYWKLWAKEDGSINVDYGNAWLDYNGINQLQQVIDTIKENPNDRRMVITGWRPDKLKELDLPCCHYSYQFYVDRRKGLHMIWNQRSADVMIGVPSDMVLAAAWLVLMAAETGTKPATVTMVFGDTHIYGEHIDNAYKYLQSVDWIASDSPVAKYVLSNFTSIYNFSADQLNLIGYRPEPAIHFKLKA